MTTLVMDPIVINIILQEKTLRHIEAEQSKITWPIGGRFRKVNLDVKNETLLSPKMFC